MSVLNAAIFGSVAALIIGGADYAIAMKKHPGEAYSLLDHYEFRMGRAAAVEEPRKVLVCVQKGAIKSCSANN